MDTQVNDLVLRIEARTRQLIMQHEQLQERCSQLQAKLNVCEDRIQALQETNEELKNQYDHLKMAKYIDFADDDTKLIRKRISKMVRDIDKCIAMLKIE